MYEDINFNLSKVNFIKNIFNIVLKREPSSLEYEFYSNDLRRKCEDTLFLKKELLHRIINSDEYLSNFLLKKIYSDNKLNKICILLCGHWRNYEKYILKYDLVIKIRSDSFTDINIDMIKNINLSNDIIYTYNNQNHKHPLHGGGCAACVVNFPIKKCKYHQNLICDVMMYGSSESIDKLASMYLHTDSILKYFHIKNTDEMKKCNKFEHSHDMFFRTSNIECEELNFMCCYPEHFLRYFLKEIYIIPDPFKNVAEFK